MTKISLENKSGYRLKITYGDEIYTLECLQRVLIPLREDEPKQFRVSIDEEYYFNKVMFSSLMVHGRGFRKYRSGYLCYMAKFDMHFSDRNIITRKLEIRQHIRRLEYDVVFPLLTLDVDMPVSYSFHNKSHERKLKAFSILNQLPFQLFSLFAGCAFVGSALFTEFEAFNIVLALMGAGFLALFISDVKKRYKLNNFGKYFEDILLYDSTPCLPVKIRKRTVIFDDEE